MQLRPSFRDGNPGPMNYFSRPVPTSRLVLLCAAVVLYLGVVHFLRNRQSVALVGLLMQYAMVLPCLLWVLKGWRGSSAAPLSVPRAAGVLMTAYIALTVPLARHEADWPSHVVDETCYSFQAHIFRAGRAVAEPLPGATESIQTTPDEINYQNHVMLARGWFTHFPPGWPALLVLGQALGVPWILNPLLGLVLLDVTLLICREVFSEGAAQLSVLMAVLSPFFLVNAAVALSHMFCAVLVAGACWLTLRGLDRKQIVSIAGAFLLLGVAIQVRPYTAFAETLVLGCAALWYSRKDGKFAAEVALAGAVSGLAAGLCMVAYNHATTGHFLVTPYAARVGAEIPSELTFDPRMIFHYLHHWGGITFKQTLFSTFPFLFLLGGYALAKEKDKRRETIILAWTFAILPLAYLLHTENSYSYFGSRFHFEGLFAAFLLAARGIELLAETWALPRRGALAVLGLLAVMQVADVKGMVESLWHVGGQYHAIKAAVARWNGQVPLVFIRDGDAYHARFANFNHADWRIAPTLYLIDADPQKRDEWACRVGRADWVVLSVGAGTQLHQEKGHSTCPVASETRH